MKYRHKSGYGFGEGNAVVGIGIVVIIDWELFGRKEKTPGLWGVFSKFSSSSLYYC